MNRIVQATISAASVISAIAVWALLTDSPGDGLLQFPSPKDLFEVLDVHGLTLARASVLTITRVILGTALGAVLGFAVAFLCFRWSTLNSVVTPFVEILRPVPPIALTPFFIIFLGLGEGSQITLIALGVFMITFVSVGNAVRNIDPMYTRAFISLGGRTSGLLRAIWFPAVLPEFASALRVSLATAFALTVAAEYLGAQGGLGYVIRNARTLLDLSSILTAAICLGVASFVLDFLVSSVMAKVTFWVPRAGVR